MSRPCGSFHGFYPYGIFATTLQLRHPGVEQQWKDTTNTRHLQSRELKRRCQQRTMVISSKSIFLFCYFWHLRFENSPTVCHLPFKSYGKMISTTTNIIINYYYLWQDRRFHYDPHANSARPPQVEYFTRGFVRLKVPTKFSGTIMTSAVGGRMQYPVTVRETILLLIAVDSVSRFDQDLQETETLKELSSYITQHVSNSHTNTRAWKEREGRGRERRMHR